MTTISNIKRNAQKTLTENFSSVFSGLIWIILILLFLTSAYTLMTTFLSSYVTNSEIFLGALIVAFILISPVLNGYFRFHLNLIKTGNAVLSDLCFYFFSVKLYFSALKLNMLFLIRMLLAAVLIYTPYKAYKLYIPDFIDLNKEVFESLGWLLLCLSALIAALFFIRYFLVCFLFEEDSTLPLNKYFQKSASIMRNPSYFFEFLFMFISFIPLFISYLVVIPALYFIPFYIISLCFLGLKILSHDKSITKIQGMDF